MANSKADVNRQVGRQSTFVLLSILLALLVGVLAVSNQSLWIDEAQSATKAMQPSLAQWWTTMVHDKGSDLQMPFYMFYLWAWAKLFDTSEIALRAANIPWFAAGLLALVWAFPQEPSRMSRDRQISIAAVTLTNAFLWYYISEARPYIVLFAFSALTFACLVRLHDDPHLAANSASWFRLFVLGVIGMCATNLIAVPWALGAIAAFLSWTGARGSLKTVTDFAWSSLFAACALIGLGVFYVWSVWLGARASAVGHTTFKNLVFVFYELLGVAGLGPGRLALREEGLNTIFAYAGPVILGTIAALILFIGGFPALRNKLTRRDIIFFGIAAILPLVALIAAGVTSHMRLLGRHFTPLLPFLLVLLAIGFEQMFFANRRWFRGVAIVALAILLISALQIRFAPRHQRDDYRSAASVARAAVDANEKVWWLADESTGEYYKLPLDSPNLTLRSNLTDSSLTMVAMPDLVCFSRPDIYDQRGEIDNYLREHNFKVTRVLPAFRIFERQPPAR
jgi:hypothetical protein